jgi:hypothetical protein
MLGGFAPLSQLLVSKYLNELADLRRVSGTARESVVREAFKTLLKDWGKSRDLIFVPEYEYETLTKDRRYIDGALLHELRVPFGYWEAKDEKDDLDEEIDKKLRRGYPQDNIVFEDSREAVLIQNKQQVMRCEVEDGTQLEKLLGLFFGYEREEIADFRKAVTQFTTDLPAVLGALREMIATAEQDNPVFHNASVKFLKHLQETINPSVGPTDVREMLIQHILTEESSRKSSTTATSIATTTWPSSSTRWRKRSLPAASSKRRLRGCARITQPSRVPPRSFPVTTRSRPFSR